MIKDYFRLAIKNTRQRKMRSWLTMLGIFVGIAAVVALISLSQGLKSAVAQQFSNLGTDKLVVQAAGGGFGPPGTAVPDPLTQKDKETIEDVDGVELALGRLIRTVELDFNDERRYTFAVTLPDDNEEKALALEANNYKLAQGRFFDDDDAKEIVIGHEFATDFFDKEIVLRDRITVQGEVFKVVGILKKSGNPQQDSTLVIPEGSLRTILDIPDDFDVIPLQIKVGEDIDSVAEKVRREMRKSRDVEEGKEDFTVETPGQVLAILNNILLVIQGVLVGIAAISLIVGGIGIMNTMYTAVIQRTKEIGVMKAVGAANHNILLLFLVESGFLGLLGGIIGVALGVGIAKLVEVIAVGVFGSALIQADISVALVTGALLFAFFIGAGSGVFPARQASKLKPVDALRK